MIDQNNLQNNLTSEMRRTILQRAIYTQPYFYNIVIPLGASKVVLFESVTGVNRDFYLTGYQSNLTEVPLGAIFTNATIYTGYDRSVYQYNALRKLPTNLIFYDARNSAVSSSSGVDRQYEQFPFLIRSNDKIYVDVEIDNPVDIDFHAILKGFNILNEIQPLSNRQIDQCNKSLAQDVEWQYFKFDLEDTPKKTYTIENDNKPRILLGFSSICAVDNLPDIKLNIIDLSRRLQLTDMAIPLQYIAPRVPIVQDAHIYYLPIEYYLEPYAKLQFDIDYTEDEVFVPVEISALTRTV